MPVPARDAKSGEVRSASLAVTAAARTKHVWFRNALLDWYDKNRRDLPWRRTRDPYAIWVSEIMLQQTRVAAVLEHYRVFLERFPNVRALADAQLDDVLAAWSGLGYYRRARMLHRCALEMVERHDGRFPQTAEELRAFPGIGRYTAAAIASIAFEEPIAVVDGNVERVLERVAGKGLTPGRVWERAQELVSPSRPGDFNQALMELGATVCLPHDPRCLVCPVRRQCAARGELPATKVVPRQKRVEIWCALERRDGHVRLLKRAANAALMAGMWELPRLRRKPKDGEAAHWRTFRHSITVTDYRVHVLRLDKEYDSRRGGEWIALEKIPGLPLTGLARKVLKSDGII
jgi:A/G-specific adenine glycosylase